MSLRVRLALTFALVAIITASTIAIVTPAIVDRGFQQAGVESDRRGGGQGLGPGPREGRGPGRAQRETTIAIVLLGIVAAGAASVLGFIVAGRLVQPLGVLRDAAADVAAGDLGRRSGIAGRNDEIGELARSFDTMAEALERSDAARRRLFQDASHELKTPLTVIDATTTAILDGVYEHDDRHLQTIREQSHLLGRVVDDLRTISLAESGRMPLELSEFDAADVLAGVARGFGSAAELAGVRLAADPTSGALAVRADRERLRQMLGALVDNALRHTPRGGTVTLEGAAQDGAIIFAVRDTGPGIADADLDHVFERFYRSEGGRDRATGTSGLGLSIVRALAMAHGGSVGVENVDPHGARIWFSMPAS